MNKAVDFDRIHIGEGNNGQYEFIRSFTYEQCRAMNVAFAERMLSARAKGLEHFTIGPIKDPTPTRYVRFDPPEHFSHCGSSAGLCAEEGDLVNARSQLNFA